ncbi:PREDICTED: protein WVD2-like 7 [Tarenaya hassleriana]|uniref:protein WVD2-like 7 n=1 Tax=Tarenaya hassleriana TaxID=28532 RepID=UPI00053C6CB0|nr:PREDICTED: protein WVD2-like 7 [Tarenaya hassleriana]
MGESACLRRSFSQPAGICSRETEEGDPVRALTESVSFGRFMSESLAWEKWSTFSHNRYLEEVEKFAKPGSVAQKKAFFEEHYKKRAAMKAAKLEEANVASHKVSGHGNAGGSQTDDPIDSQVQVTVTTSMVVDEIRQEEICNITEDLVVDVNSGTCISEVEVKTDVEAGEVTDKSMENLELPEATESHFEVAVPDGKVFNEGNPASSTKEKRTSSSSGSKASGRRPRLTPSYARELDSSHERSEKGTNSNRKKSISATKKQKISTLESNKGLLQMPQQSSRSSTSANVTVEVDKKRTVLNSVHMSIKYVSPRQMSKTEPKFSVRSSTVREAASPNSKATPRSSSRTKATGEVDNKKRLRPSSAHMSINFASSLHQKVPIKSSTRRETTSTTPKAAGEAVKKKMSVSSSVHMSEFASSPCQTSKTGKKIPIRSSTTQEANSSKAGKNVLPKGGKAWVDVPGSQKTPLTCSFRRPISTRTDVGGTAKGSPRTAKNDLDTAKCSARASTIRLPKLPLKNHLSEDNRKDTIVGSSISVRIPTNEQMESSVNQGKLSTPRGTKARACTISSPFRFRSDERVEKRKEFFKKLEERSKNEAAATDQLPSSSKMPLTGLVSPRRSLRSKNNGNSHRPPMKTSSVITAAGKENAAAGAKKRSIKIHMENLSPNIQQ